MSGEGKKYEEAKKKIIAANEKRREKNFLTIPKILEYIQPQYNPIKELDEDMYHEYLKKYLQFGTLFVEDF